MYIKLVKFIRYFFSCNRKEPTEFILIPFQLIHFKSILKQIHCFFSFNSATIMPESDVLKHENVNGVMLSLKVDGRHSSPKYRQFTISFFSSKENKSKWPVISLCIAVLANIYLALGNVRISLTVSVVTLIVFSFLIFFWVTHSVQSETLQVIPTMGIQSSVKFVFGKEDNFIPWSSIDDVIINEVIKMNRVLYFLTLLVKEDGVTRQDSEATQLIPLFKYTKPRLMMLESIYSELQELLRESQGVGAGDIGEM